MTESVMTNAAQSVRELIERLPQWKDRIRVVDIPINDEMPMAAVVLVFSKDSKWHNTLAVQFQVLLLADTHENVTEGQVISRSTLVSRTYDGLYKRRVLKELRNEFPSIKHFLDAGFVAGDSQEYLSSFSCKGAVESSLVLFADAC